MCTFKKFFLTLQFNCIEISEATIMIVQGTQESLNPLYMQYATRFDQTLSHKTSKALGILVWTPAWNQ